MTPDPTDRIVITNEDLRDSQIDEMILLHHNSVPGPVEPVERKPTFSLLYSVWFYLLLAGAVGAFTAWALIEPSFEDGILFTGKVEKVEAADFLVEGKPEQ